jgi:hypothetical protein
MYLNKHISFLNMDLIQKYLQTMKRNMRKSKKMDAWFSWEAILHYARIYCIHVIWEEGSDKLINLSFLSPKCFCHSNAPHYLKQHLSRISLLSQNSDALNFYFKSWGRVLGSNFFGPWTVWVMKEDVYGCGSCGASADSWSPMDLGTESPLIHLFVEFLISQALKSTGNR